MKKLLAFGSLVATAGVAVAGSPISATASATHYVSVAGSGNTTTSFRVESYGGGTGYAQFGLADFSFGTVSNFTAGTATVTVSNDGAQDYLTVPSDLDVYITTDTGSISSLRYQFGGTDNTATNNLDPALSSGGNSLFLLGSLGVTSLAAGATSTGTYTVSSSLATYLKSELGSGGTVRLVVAADESVIGGSNDQEFYLSGATNTKYTTPTLAFAPAATPEPAPLAILGLGALGLLIRRRR